MTRCGTALFLLAILPFVAACATTAAKKPKDPVYATYGVHNPPSVSPCTFPNCRYKRGPGEPPDPSYPPYWESSWTMYRVYNGYVENSPPYDGKPPAPLKEGGEAAALGLLIERAELVQALAREAKRGSRLVQFSLFEHLVDRLALDTLAPEFLA